ARGCGSTAEAEDRAWGMRTRSSPGVTLVRAHVRKRDGRSLMAPPPTRGCHGRPRAERFSDRYAALCDRDGARRPERRDRDRRSRRPEIPELRGGRSGAFGWRDSCRVVVEPGQDVCPSRLKPDIRTVPIDRTSTFVEVTSMPDPYANLAQQSPSSTATSGLNCPIYPGGIVLYGVGQQAFVYYAIVCPSGPLSSMLSYRSLSLGCASPDCAASLVLPPSAGPP